MSLLDRTGLFGSAPSWGAPFRPSVAQRSEALRALARHDPTALRRLIRDARAASDFFAQAWCLAEPDGSIGATALLAPHAGNTLHAMMTRGHTDAMVEPLGELLRTAVAGAQGCGRAMVQALVEPTRRREWRVLCASGMTQLATLGYYERLLPRRGRVAAEWPAGATISACDVHTDAGRATLGALLQETYRDTRDCPALTGMRTPDETLDGHITNHAVEPDLWSLVWLEGRPAAVSLVAPIPDCDSAEIVYFGVAAWARGQGLGPALLQHALGRLEHRGMRSVHLACDEANEPAIRMYHNAGFHRTIRRIAFVQSLRA